MWAQDKMGMMRAFGVCQDYQRYVLPSVTRILGGLAASGAPPAISSKKEGADAAEQRHAVDL